MAAGLPYKVYEAVVQCFGRCFHYKDGVAAFMTSAGVPSVLVNKYRNLPKFVWARRVLEELGNSDTRFGVRFPARSPFIFNHLAQRPTTQELLFSRIGFVVGSAA